MLVRALRAHSTTTNQRLTTDTDKVYTEMEARRKASIDPPQKLDDVLGGTSFRTKSKRQARPCPWRRGVRVVTGQSETRTKIRTAGQPACGKSVVQHSAGERKG